MLIRVTAVEVCDATTADSSNAAGKKTILYSRKVLNSPQTIP